MAKPYGTELILDLRGCDPRRFTRFSLKEFCTHACQWLKFHACTFHFCDDLGGPHNAENPQVKGCSAVLFIVSSSITIHALELRKELYVNVFSCKPFEVSTAERLARDWFEPTDVRREVIKRGTWDA